MIRIPVKKAKNPIIYNPILVNMKKVLDLQALTDERSRCSHSQISLETFPLAICLFKNTHIIPIPKAMIAFDKAIMGSGVKSIFE
ncbi:MAG TPA: hypothetical protein VJA23_04945 [Candidatus Nanoarchaeia archaeon]|nr:hypothetical protein [Candidatus Nanoarchaeia archaeon]